MRYRFVRPLVAAGAILLGSPLTAAAAPPRSLAPPALTAPLLTVQCTSSGNGCRSSGGSGATPAFRAGPNERLPAATTPRQPAYGGGGGVLSFRPGPSDGGGAAPRRPRSLDDDEDAEMNDAMERAAAARQRQEDELERLNSAPTTGLLQPAPANGPATRATPGGNRYGALNQREAFEAAARLYRAQGYADLAAIAEQRAQDMQSLGNPPAMPPQPPVQQVQRVAPQQSGAAPSAGSSGGGVSTAIRGE